jgi:hypothetical protein
LAQLLIVSVRTVRLAWLALYGGQHAGQNAQIVRPMGRYPRRTPKQTQPGDKLMPLELLRFFGLFIIYCALLALLGASL